MKVSKLSLAPPALALAALVLPLGAAGASAAPQPGFPAGTWTGKGGSAGATASTARRPAPAGGRIHAQGRAGRSSERQREVGHDRGRQRRDLLDDHGCRDSPLRRHRETPHLRGDTDRDDVVLRRRPPRRQHVRAAFQGRASDHASRPLPRHRRPQRGRRLVQVDGPPRGQRHLQHLTSARGRSLEGPVRPHSPIQAIASISTSISGSASGAWTVVRAGGWAGKNVANTSFIAWK